ncbi:MAG: nucleotidyltransferase domain-containing protein [Chloroherpetonaceae bacterium]|nr:nucleotidyltransferase domain-containing protein [Chloroherpetonaceae bacterium]MDW8437123.1 nucleotidyltransferase domain-containing protein [Chloroherpetonaceae bacterium]
MKFGLKEETIAKIQAVFEKYPEVERVVIYGSRAKGNFRQGSDIDLTLIGERLTESHRAKIASELDELNTPYLFDVSIYHRLRSPDLEEHIRRVGKIFYEKTANAPIHASKACE